MGRVLEAISFALDIESVLCYFAIERVGETMFRLVWQDLNQFAHGSKFRDKIKVLILSPGFMAVLLTRAQASLYKHHLLVLSYLVYRLNLNLHGIDVLPGSIIDGGLRIEHPVGIVIGAGSVIGSNCTIMQGVTLGVRNVVGGVNDDKFPSIGNNVFIGVNSTILGGISIGDDVIIGAHSLVLVSCPANSRVIGTSIHLPQDLGTDSDG